MNYDYIFKIILIGDHGVGKSCFINVLSHGIYYPDYSPTIGVDLRIVYSEVTEGKRVKCHVWDTAGQEQFHSITRSYFKGAAGAIVMYDTSNPSTFTSVKKWLAIIEAESPVTNLPKVLIAAKCDKKDKVKESDAIALAEEYNMPFIKISSLRIQKVSCVVPALCEEIVQKSLKKGFLTGIRLLDNEKDTNSIRETTECKKEPKRCCIIS